MEEQLKREDLEPRAPTSISGSRSARLTRMRGDYDRAWEHYETGNQRQRPLVSYDPVGFESRHEEIAEVFSREFLEQHAGEGFESDAPIFIVGLPRSGSTLIEQILASHSQVEGTLELATLGEIAVSTGRYRRDRQEYPEAVRELRGHDFRAFGKQYIEETQDLPHERQAAIHRQAAEQLLACRLRAPDPAEREDHQRAPPSARQPPRQLQAALRQGPELHLRHARARRCTTASTTRS